MEPVCPSTSFPVQAAKAQPLRCKRSVFVWCLGQDDNVGDVLLRRALLHQLFPLGKLHVYVGKVCPDFVDALMLRPQDVRYRNFWKWYWDAWQAHLAGGVLICDKPGELTLDLLRLLRQFANASLTMRGISKRSVSISMGAGIRRPRPLMLPFFRWALRGHRLLIWRDPVSAELFGIGDVAPDLALIDSPSASTVFVDSEVASRNKLLVSLRGDREFPPASWIDGIRQFAGSQPLQIEVVVQVRRDRQRALELCEALPAPRLDWDNQSLLEQEQRLREVYRSARMVISDRLHVLLLAMMEGAIPVCLAATDEQKIQRHFAAFGELQVRIDCRDRTPTWVKEALEAALGRAAETAAAGQRAQQQLRSWFERVNEMAATK